MDKQSVIFLVLVALLLGAAAAGIISKMKSDSNTQALGSQITPPTGQEVGVTTSLQQPTEAPKKKSYSKFPGALPENQIINKKAVIETAKGKIEFEIYPEATKAASNFIFLTNDNFYDGLTFHRVEPRFVIQGGDPSGNGTSGPGYQFEDEPVTRPYRKGTVAMANSGPNTNGSQFFIMLADTPLPPKYTIFGQVISGQDVVDKIAVGDVMQKVTILPLK